MTGYKVGDEVVRTKGDYVVGRVGKVIDVNTDTNRARVLWGTTIRTWVSFNSLALTSVPYVIKDRGDAKYPKYIKL